MIQEYHRDGATPSHASEDPFAYPDVRTALKALHVDFPITLAPRYIGPPLEPGINIFGVRFPDIKHVGGSYPEATVAPLATYGSVEEIESAYRWPSPDWWEYDELALQLEGYEPFGSVEEVRQEVRDNLRILGAGGGYILAPCHNVQVVTPVENVVEMYIVGYEEGWS